MSRPPRIQFEGAFYHVYHRGNRRERIFWDDSDYAKFEDFMIEAMNWSGVTLYDWALMPNHLHMVVETPDGNLSEFMQRLLTRYARYFNWTHKKVGHVFQGRYGARLCDKEPYFLALLRYVELNPYRLKKGMLAKLGQWKWSSLRFHMGAEKPPEGLQIAMQRVLERFGIDVKEARQKLSQFLVEGLSEGNWEAFYQVKANRYMGDETFIEHVKSRQQEPIRSEERKLKRLGRVEEMMLEVSKCFSVDVQRICSPSQERLISRIRQAMVYVGRAKYRFANVELADQLKRQESSVSMMVRKIGGREDKLKEIQILLEHLKVNEITEVNIEL